MDMSINPVGVVRSPLRDKAAAPKQGREGAPEAFIEIESRYREGLLGLEPGQEVFVLSWLHLADRRALRVHPRGDAANPLQGVFNTRSPDRPNPLGLHRVRILAVEETGLRVAPLEAVDGTPVVDVKPVLECENGRTMPGDAAVSTGACPAAASDVRGHADAAPCPATETAGDLPGARPAGFERDGSGEEGLDIEAAAQAVVVTGRDGWRRGLLAGFNGNLSVRLSGPDGDRMLVTCGGSAKGRLRRSDLTLVSVATGEALAPGCASSEAGMHLEIYRRQPQARAVVHCHPPKLLALSLLDGVESLLRLPLFEAEFYAAMLGTAPAHAPGTAALAEAVGEAARERRAVFMERHGLVCWGSDLASALSLCEEIESLAGIRLLAR